MARVRLRAGVYLTVLVLLGAACARPDSGFDIESLIEAIPQAVVPDDPSAVGAVTCPDPVSSNATTIECDATISGWPVGITAVISADGEVAISTDAVLLDLAEVSSAVAERLTADLGVESSVVCHETVIVVVVADEISCIATEPSGTEHELVVTVTDSEGNWSVDLAR